MFMNNTIVLIDSDSDSGSCVWQVVESSKRWWKCRNRFNQVGFVPFNILEPMAHVDSPVNSKPPNVRQTTFMFTHTYTLTLSAQRSGFTCAYLSEFLCLLSLLHIPADPSSSSSHQDFFSGPSQSSFSASGSVTLPTASAQLTCIQPTRSSCRRHR